jgi:hypothetical protein
MKLMDRAFDPQRAGFALVKGAIAWSHQVTIADLAASGQFVLRAND